jgi:hypothetical protein
MRSKTFDRLKESHYNDWIDVGSYKITNCCKVACGWKNLEFHEHIGNYCFSYNYGSFYGMEYIKSKLVERNYRSMFGFTFQTSLLGAMSAFGTIKEELEEELENENDSLIGC